MTRNKMKSWRMLTLVTVCLLTLVLLAGCGGNGNNDNGSGGTESPGGTESNGASGDDGTVYQLSLATHDPVASNQTMILQEWADRIYEESNGRIEITIFAGGSLAGSAEVLDGIKTGAVDIGWVYTTFYPGQFPIVDAIALPMRGVETATQAVEVLWAMYEESDELQAELNTDFKTLMMYTNPINFVSTNSTPVYTVEDMQGLKLRATAGTATDMLIAWGATPIAMGPGDIYQSVERGILDGYVLEYTGMKSFNLPEVTNYYTEVKFFVSPFLTIMNNNTYNALPADLQQVIDNNSGYAISQQLAQAFQDDWDAAREEIIASGSGEIIEPAGADLAGFEVAAQEYAANWVADNSGSLDAQAYLDRLDALIQQYQGY